jgi:hypothetical protein
MRSIYICVVRRAEDRERRKQFDGLLALLAGYAQRICMGERCVCEFVGCLGHS